MATATSASGSTVAPLGRPVLEERKPRPVLGWAALGVVFFGIFLYTMAGWIFSGDAHHVSTGRTPVPTYMLVCARIEEGAGVIAAFVIMYYVIIRPWRRTGHLSQDALIILAFMTNPWQDSILNYVKIWQNYNSVYFNLGGWDRWVPGFIAPHGNRVVQPLAWDIPFYIWGGFGIMALGALVLRKVKARWPQLTQFQVILVACAMGFTLDLIMEPLIWTIPGSFSWMGAIDGLTLFHGHYYQFPIYEAVFAGLWWAGLSCFRYFEDDKGQTIAERGLDKVHVSPRRKAWIRFFAFVGVTNIILVGYNIPMAIFGAHSSPIPQDVRNRSYFMNGVCGPGTGYVCSGSGVPITWHVPAR